ncbi:uncharacterized protein LOC133795731 [Humulus lupulus]|uniref:uncharacterized protein LOC133795731 n=1 Tax=Humulus lupulus TaxID=3486 RepID=UPI002B417622|nr:uncharacterized protein LOC133795731 [Humulus lupulus]
MDNCNIASWNVRGVNNKNKQNFVLEFCSLNKIGVGALLETKLKDNKIKEMMMNKFSSWDYYSIPTIEGRLLIIWRKSFVKVIVLAESSQFAHCYVKMSGQEEACCITFVYGLNTTDERKSLWVDLLNLKFPMKPWLLLGDFNEVFNSEDRVGGNPISMNDLTDASLWQAQVHVEALKRSGSNFTWSNNQDGASRIYSRIDHAFANEEWHDIFPNSTIHFAWEAISDHCSCVVAATVSEKIGLKPFRYYNFWVEHPEFKGSDVVDHFLNHFRGFMGSKNTTNMRLNVKCMGKGARLGLEQQLAILKAFSNKEIKDVMFSILDEKSPGPDGYGSGFFKIMWPVVGTEFCKVVQDFFATGSMPYEFHSTMISLTPKKDNPSRAVDYRPIACYSTIYKCISKLTCLRLAGVLPSLVNQNQGAFIKGRSLAHNVMILQDLLKNYKRKTVSPRCTIKIDISKAYDTVNWDFLEALLNAYNLPEKFVRMVMICIRSTTYSITMNGRVQGSFKGEKGLRQGDPLSPLLFVLIMEYLTRRLQLAASQSLFRYHPLCKGLKLINLCFADDLILFSKGSRQSVLVIKEVLSEFNKTTGLHVSEDKSQVFFGGVNSNEKSAILNDLQLIEGVFPFQYLGVPLRPTKWKAEDCGIIIKKINQRLHSWASRHLSFAGRMQLIHSVLFGLRNYWMSIFVLPHSVTKEVEKMCRGFLWGVNGNRSKIHIASWDKVCLPKSYGGLGFKNGIKWNQANLAKFIWAITEKSDLLWVKWINSIYLKDVSFWSYELKPDTSWYWRKLCHLSLRFTCSEIAAAGCSGKFKSSALYNSSLNQTQVCYYFKAIWNSYNLPKHRFLLWQVVNSQLLTRDNLIKFHLNLVSLDCPVCGISLESHEHLFFSCSLSGKVVDQIFNWLGLIAWPKDFSSWINWLNLKVAGLIHYINIVVLAAVIYYLWINRNRCIFEGYSHSVSLIVNDIRDTVKYRLLFVKNRNLNRLERNYLLRLLM